MVAVTAHRGASGDYPENLRTAFQAAIDLAGDIIEFDVRLIATGPSLSTM